MKKIALILLLLCLWSCQTPKQSQYNHPDIFRDNYNPKEQPVFNDDRHLSKEEQREHL